MAVGSGFDATGRLRWNDPQFERGYGKWAAYSHLDLLGVRASPWAPATS